jgi:energy-coupling factor transport system permease protein
MINPRAWLLWVAITAAVIMVASNPLYALSLLIVVQMVKMAQGKADNAYDLPLLRIALVILILGAVYNALFVHSGDTVLFIMPDLPLIGGPITLEALLDGMANGMLLVALLALFLSFNAIVPVSDLLRMTPMAFRDVGVVILVAFTYLPETRRHLSRIREAQAIRGHEMHGFRDWRPVVVPLLVGGLERSMQIAESMVARGYGSVADRASSPAEQVLLILCLLMALVGWVFALWTGWPGWLILLVSVAGVLVLIWRRGKYAKRTNLKPHRWTPVDGIVIVVTLIALVIIIGMNTVDSSSLTWNPYPIVLIPDFDSRIGFAILLLAVPAIVGKKREAERDN